MGLFDVFKKNDSQDEIVGEVVFEKKVLETTNIVKDLGEIAKVHNLMEKDLDFKILSFKTYYKNVDSPKYKELKEIERESFFKEKNILNPKLEIIQKLKIKVFKKNSSKFPIKISLGANKSLTKIMATIKKQDAVQYFDGLEAEIIAQLDIKKAKQGIFLGCFDEGVGAEVKKMVSSIRVNKKIEENIVFTLSQAYEMQKNTPGAIVYNYKTKKVDVDDKIDHSDKGFMYTAKEGDIIIEVIKPQGGKAGRNCKGEFLSLKEVELFNEIPQIRVSDDIEIRDMVDKIQYIAKRSGFINEAKDNEFEIRDELVIDEVSFKTTGSIKTGGDKDIKINIECNDSMSDAIGAGVNIETSEIKAEGNVGNGATVKAKVIEIGGQTHQSSILYGGDVTINLHKGFVDGEKIVIDLLEGGKVVGDIVHIKKASGGEIHAKEVYIDTVLSNVNVHASNYIELEKVEGEGNKFIIDAKAQRGFKEKVENLESNIIDIGINITQIIKKIKQIKIKINHEKETTQNIYERIKHLRETGVNPPPSLIVKMKENQNRIKEHNLLIKELKDAKMGKDAFIENLKNIQSSVFEAKVINNSAWKEFNEVTFEIIDPPVTASHLLKEGEIARVITLQGSEDGEFTLNRKG